MSFRIAGSILIVVFLIWCDFALFDLMVWFLNTPSDLAILAAMITPIAAVWFNCFVFGKVFDFIFEEDEND